MLPRQPKGGVHSGIYLLRPTPELLTNCLEHRTQIIYTPDIALMCMWLDLRPGCVVLETGTGSGSVSYSIISAIAPTGHLYTYDFHEVRSQEARRDFDLNGVGRFVTTSVADATKSRPQGSPPRVQVVGPDTTAPFALQDDESPFGLPPQCLDAAFLDLPAPHQALAHVLPLLKPNGGICNFSPCIEQVARVCEFLRTNDFTEIRTFEVLQRPYAVRPYRMASIETPGTRKRPRESEHKEPRNAKARRKGSDAEDGDDASDAEADEVGDDTATVPTRQLFISCRQIPVISYL